MSTPAIQDTYPDNYSHCYGCGRLNAHGLHVRTFWHDGASLSEFTPRPEHMALPGYVYGGLLASLVDCHATGTASAALTAAAGLPVGEAEAVRCVTARLTVNYLRPTPLGPVLRLHGTVLEQSARKVVVAVSLRADDVECVTGEVVCVRVPDSFGL